MLSSGKATYQYDQEGNLIERITAKGEQWRYEWGGSGSLLRVIRPDEAAVTFSYDALGRRVSKTFKGKTTHWVWETNRPLHEWQTLALDGQNTDDIITWLFEEDSFFPVGKLQSDTQHSILTDYLGTPLEMIDQAGQRTWAAQTTAYGRIRMEEGTRNACPFRFQGQYEDVETGLYYNRFRYYAPQEGIYISQDPIGLAGGDRLYAYVADPNAWVDPFGLSCTKELKKNMNAANRKLRKDTKSMKRAWQKEKGSAAHHIIPGDDPRAFNARAILNKHGIDINSAENGIYLRHDNPVSKQPGAYHREIHTGKYYDNINERISDADRLNGKQGVLDEMESLQNELLFNKTDLWK